MRTNLISLISSVQQDDPKGIVVCDCDDHDVFYVPHSELDDFWNNEQLSKRDQSLLQAAKGDLSSQQEFLIVTFQNSEIANITAFEDENNFSCISHNEVS